MARRSEAARWHLHFTPTSASWLNLIEGWCSVPTRKVLTNTSFTSTGQPKERIPPASLHALGSEYDCLEAGDGPLGKVSLENHSTRRVR